MNQLWQSAESLNTAHARDRISMQIEDFEGGHLGESGWAGEVGDGAVVQV